MTGNNIPTEDWLNDEERELFGRVEVQHPRSKEDVWAALQAQTQTAPTPQRSAKIIPLGSIPLSIAASVALLVLLTLTARLYTRTVEVTSGELATVALPDGSTVQLNTDTRLSYQPYWWWARRAVSLEGEAFFEVAKGSN
ncbi:MAG: FecR family protein, partial [Bacteroidota bacterium]